MLINQNVCINCGHIYVVEINEVYHDGFGIGATCPLCKASNALSNEIHEVLSSAITNYFQIHNHIKVSEEHAKSFLSGGGADEDFELIESKMGRKLSKEAEQYYVYLLAHLITENIVKN